MQKRNTLFFMLFMVLIVALCMLNMNCGVSRNLTAAEYRSHTLIDPYNPKVHYELADCYYREGNYKMAIYEYKQAIKYADNYTEAHAGLGLAYSKVHAYASAERHINIALVQDPKIKTYRSELVNLYNELGRQNLKFYNVVEAMDMFRKALILDKRDKTARSELSVAYCIAATELKNFEKLEPAKAFYSKALELDGKSGIAKNGLSDVLAKMGQQYQQQNQVQLAIVQYKEALEYNRDNQMAKSGLETLQ